jgi:hypothetical protein
MFLLFPKLESKVKDRGEKGCDNSATPKDHVEIEFLGGDFFRGRGTAFLQRQRHGRIRMRRTRSRSRGRREVVFDTSVDRTHHRGVGSSYSCHGNQLAHYRRSRSRNRHRHGCHGKKRGSTRRHRSWRKGCDRGKSQRKHGAGQEGQRVEKGLHGCLLAMRELSELE